MIKGKLGHRIHYKVKDARQINMIIMNDSKEYQVESRIEHGQNQWRMTARQGKCSSTLTL